MRSCCLGENWQASSRWNMRAHARARTPSCTGSHSCCVSAMVRTSVAATGAVLERLRPWGSPREATAEDGETTGPAHGGVGHALVAPPDTVSAVSEPALWYGLRMLERAGGGLRAQVKPENLYERRLLSGAQRRALRPWGPMLGIAGAGRPRARGAVRLSCAQLSWAVQPQAAHESI
jgi:hypothetical protein